jgi:hypothetical protein
VGSGGRVIFAPPQQNYATKCESLRHDHRAELQPNDVSAGPPFSSLKTFYPFVSEALLIPFYLDKTPVGTVWIVSHKLERKFDREDERIVKVLANFASAGWQLWKARASAEKLTEELMVANEALQSQAILYEREQQRAAQTLEDTKAQLSKKVVALENELDGLKNNLKRL